MQKTLYTTNQLATEFGVESRTIAKRLEGLKPASERKTGRGVERRYYLADVYSHLIADKPDSAARVTADEARRRKMVAEASLSELELAKARGEMITLENLESMLSTINGAVRAQLMAIAHKFAPVLAMESDKLKCQAILHEAISEALDELSRTEIEIEVDDQGAGGDSGVDSESSRFN